MRRDVVQYFPTKRIPWLYLLIAFVLVGFLGVSLPEALHWIIARRYAGTTTNLGRVYWRQSVDDDEVHDHQLASFALQSLVTWSGLSKMKTPHHRQKRDEEVVCYNELGCFRDEGPFDYLDMLPSSPDEIGTSFYLFTRHNKQHAQVFSYKNMTLMHSSFFNASRPTKLIIHGFGSTCSRIWAYEMRLALLSIDDCNVICVDWEKGAAIPNYVRAAVNTRLVGKQVAYLIKWLNKQLHSRAEDFHLIGFSLGAHVAGFAGQDVKNLSRITGLDPAGPLFESYENNFKLDSTDAIFVDVIHSNGDSLLMGGLGSWEPIGHVDFYPNGGRVQKGCSNLFLGAFRDLIWANSQGDGRSLCNHRRAYKFFTESVSPRCPFPAFECDSYDSYLSGACFEYNKKSCVQMGYYAHKIEGRQSKQVSEDGEPVKHGGVLLYLMTREDEPFCANQYRVRVESSRAISPKTTYGTLEMVVINHDNINETFYISQDSMSTGTKMQRIIVAHPAIDRPVKVQLKYTAYKGWLYTGVARWSLDRILLNTFFGKFFCSHGLLLPSNVPITVRLKPGLCLNSEPPTSELRPKIPFIAELFTPAVQNKLPRLPPGLRPVPHVNLTVNPHHRLPPYVNHGSPMRPHFSPEKHPKPSSEAMKPAYNVAGDSKWSGWHPVQRPSIEISDELLSNEVNVNGESFEESTKYPEVEINYSYEDTGTMSTTPYPIISTETIEQDTESPVVSSKTCYVVPILDNDSRPTNKTMLKCVSNDEVAQLTEAHEEDPIYDDDGVPQPENNDIETDDPDEHIGSTMRTQQRPTLEETSSEKVTPDFNMPVDLPPNLRHTLNQLQSEGLVPQNQNGSFKYNKRRYSNNNGQNEKLIPSSRSLDPRPVVLSNRRRKGKKLESNIPKVHRRTNMNNVPFNINRFNSGMHRMTVPKFNGISHSSKPINSQYPRVPMLSSFGPNTRHGLENSQRFFPSESKPPSSVFSSRLAPIDLKTSEKSSSFLSLPKSPRNGVYFFPVYAYDRSKSHPTGTVQRRILSSHHPPFIPSHNGAVPISPNFLGSTGSSVNSDKMPLEPSRLTSLDPTDQARFKTSLTSSILYHDGSMSHNKDLHDISDSRHSDFGPPLTRERMNLAHAFTPSRPILDQTRSL